MKRKCAYPKCTTILNQYNSEPCCHLHQVQYKDMMDQHIEDCTHKIKKLRLYIRQAGQVNGMKRRIEKYQKRIKRLERLRDRRYPCKAIEPIDGNSIYTRDADVPVGF